MKKRELLLILMLLTGTTSFAQFGDFGVKLGLGMATLRDDLATKSPTWGANIGGYVNFNFYGSESAFGEVFYLQTGLNMIHRGSHFREVLENGNNFSIRTGFYDAWYAQLPVLACVHFELPVREEGHVVGAFVGPAVSWGLFGKYGDRKITPGIPTANANYDVNFNGAPGENKVFNHINRLDVSAIAGLSYERDNLNLSLYLDYGFIATSDGEDILRIIENNQYGNQGENNVNVKIPNGYNLSVMLMLTYKLGSLF